jgi:hypothetical protein
MLVMGNKAWAPELPARYIRTPSIPKAPVKSQGGGGKADTVATGATVPAGGPPEERNLQVTNTHKNPEFDQFKAKLGNMKLNDAIKKGGLPPNVTREDPKLKKMVELSMCGSWHLRGTCMSLCGRRLDHGPHTAEEDEALMTWCQTALA